MPDGPQGKIFINYRRGDDPGFTTALYMHLEGEFGPGRLFMDVEGHIKPGDNFDEVLSAQVAECDVLLAIVGPRWAELSALDGTASFETPPLAAPQMRCDLMVRSAKRRLEPWATRVHFFSDVIPGRAPCAFRGDIGVIANKDEPDSRGLDPHRQQ
jgi:hypothetical protein